jgi:adenosylcobalamin-dependent ribonucleoside-diphosphate reductase
MKVIKKSGFRQDYSIDKVKIALQKTATSIGLKFLEGDWKEFKPRVLARLEPIMEGRDEIFFWEIDDAVIDSLLRSRFKDIAKEYIQSRSRSRQDKLNDLGLSRLSMWLLNERYLKKDIEGNAIETAREMMCRVATSIATAEKTPKLREEYSEKFTNMLCNLEFLPSSPCLVSAGTNKKGTYLSCITGDTIIHTTFGDKPIKELYDNNIENFYLYSCDGKEVKLGKADKVIKTGEKIVYEVKLDSGYSIKATPDHKFMMRDGSYKNVWDLKSGDSLMPFNFFHANKKGYRYIFPKINGTKREQSMPAYHFVATEYYGDIGKNYIHHKDFNKLNDSPDNLQLMTEEEHRKLHSDNSPMKTERWRKWFSDRMIGNTINNGKPKSKKFKQFMEDNNPMYKEENKKKVSEKQMDIAREKGERVIKICLTCGKEFESRTSHERKYCSLKCHYEHMRGNTYWKLRDKNNHKVISVKLIGMENVYDIQSVDKYHNFAANGVFIHNCYAFEIEDSLDSIFSVLKDTSKIFQMGGGVGISVSKLREKGAIIKTSNGVSSGPVSFLHLFNTMVDTVKAGGFRRGALLALMHYTHPDIEEFIKCKRDTNELKNMNISIMVDDEFFKSVAENKIINLKSPRDGKIVRKIPAALLLEQIATNIWETGEPGLLFYDRINKDNPTPHLGDLRVCNPCAEATLLNREACDLGSINLVKHVKDGEIDWDKLASTVKLAIRFLDNMIDASPQPTKEIDESIKRTRKAGLGVMGFADILLILGVKYSSKEAIEWAGKIMSFINDVADKESIELGKEKGLYTEYKEGYRKRRNAIVTTVAPTGSLSLISGVSSGIEPNFSKEYTRVIGTEIVKVSHPIGTSKIFETFNEIPLDQHLAILAEFQKNTENAVSKTCNVPELTTVNDIKALIIKAHDMEVKGITIFRDHCSRESLIKPTCDECKI